MPVPDDITSGEIVRTLRGLQDEIRALRGEHVRRDLYEAHRAAQQAELARIDERCRAETAKLEARMESAERDRAMKRWQLLLSSWGAGLALMTSLILLIAK